MMSSLVVIPLDRFFSKYQFRTTEQCPKSHKIDWNHKKTHSKHAKMKTKREKHQNFVRCTFTMNARKSYQTFNVNIWQIIFVLCCIRWNYNRGCWWYCGRCVSYTISMHIGMLRIFLCGWSHGSFCYAIWLCVISSNRYAIIRVTVIIQEQSIYNKRTIHDKTVLFKRALFNRSVPVSFRFIRGDFIEFLKMIQLNEFTAMHAIKKHQKITIKTYNKHRNQLNNYYFMHLESNWEIKSSTFE